MSRIIHLSFQIIFDYVGSGGTTRKEIGLLTVLHTDMLRNLPKITVVREQSQNTSQTVWLMFYLTAIKV